MLPLDNKSCIHLSVSHVLVGAIVQYCTASRDFEIIKVSINLSIVNRGTFAFVYQKHWFPSTSKSRQLPTVKN